MTMAKSFYNLNTDHLDLTDQLNLLSSHSGNAKTYMQGKGLDVHLDEQYIKLYTSTKEMTNLE